MKAGQSKLLHFFGSEHETDVKVPKPVFSDKRDVLLVAS